MEKETQEGEEQHQQLLTKDGQEDSVCMIVDHEQDQQNAQIFDQATADGKDGKDQNNSQSGTLNEKKFLSMTLNPGISVFNVISFYIMQLATYLTSNFIVAFLSFLLVSEYYKVPQESVGGVVGTLGFYSALLSFIADFGLGTIMDIVGRKIPVTVGLLICGLTMIAMPYGYYLYPNLLILRIIVALAMLPGQNAPLIVDYIHHKSLGIANGYQNVVIQTAVLCATTGALQLSTVMNVKYIFIMVGSLILFMDVILVFGIKDIKPRRPPPPPTEIQQQSGVKRSIIEEKTSMLKITLLAFWHALRDQREFVVAIMGNFCFRFSTIAIFQYGPIFIATLYPPEERDKATSLTSLMLLIANLTVIPLAMVVGYLSDRLKIWKLLLLFCCLGAGFLTLMVTNPVLGPQLYIGFVGGTAFNVTVLLLSLIMLSKIVKRESRGTLFGAFSCFGDFGVVIINLAGGQLYDNVSHLWPFLLAIIALGTLITLIIIFGLLKQLNV